MVIGVSQCATDDWRLNMNNEITREAALYRDLEIEVLIENSEGKVGVQAKQIKGFLDTGVDLLIVSPGDSERLAPIIGQVYDANIPVVIIDRKINSDQFTAYVGANNFEIGKEIGEYTARYLNDKGNILEVTGELVSSPFSERSNGFKSIINMPQRELSLSSIEIDSLLDKAHAQKDSITALLDKADFIFAHSDPIAFEIKELLNQYDLPQPPMVGIDGLLGENNGIEMILDGTLEATYLYPTGGDKAVQLAITILNKEKHQKYTYLNSLQIDKTNVVGIKNRFLELKDLQKKIDLQREVTHDLDFLVKRQKSFLVLLLIALILLVVIVGLIIGTLRRKNKTNLLLDNKNKIIKAKNDKISDQKNNLTKMVKVAEEAIEMKLRFLSTISHELRNSVNLINLSIDNIDGVLGSNPLQRDIPLQSIKKSAGRLKMLSDEILNLKRFDSKSFKPIPATTNLSALVERVLSIIAVQAQEKEIKLVTNLKEGIIFDFDPSMIEKVVFNLVANAIKFTSKNGSINVKLYERSSNVYLKVRDNGVGMNPEEVSKIFDPYYTAAQNRDANSGFGYGLAICKELVQLHGGKITVDSAKNLGSSFLVKVPKEQAKPVIKEVQRIAPEENYLNLKSRYKILLVEDNVELSNLLCSILDKEFEVFLAYNGKEGLQATLKHVPDIIISDVLMPEMDGVAFCQKIKENPRTSHIPFVLLTAIATEDSKIDGFDIGADDYLIKPVSAKILISRIENLIKTRVNIINGLSKDYNLLREINTKKTEDRVFIERLLDIVQENIANEHLSVAQISGQMNMSYSVLYRKLKSISNFKLVEIIKKQRLHFAAKQLILTDAKVNEVAYASGFSDVKYFRRCFKEEFDDFPSGFRKGLKP